MSGWKKANTPADAEDNLPAPTDDEFDELLAHSRVH